MGEFERKDAKGLYCFLTADDIGDMRYAVRVSPAYLHHEMLISRTKKVFSLDACATILDIYANEIAQELDIYEIDDTFIEMTGVEFYSRYNADKSMFCKSKNNCVIVDRTASILL